MLPLWARKTIREMKLENYQIEIEWMHMNGLAYLCFQMTGKSQRRLYAQTHNKGSSVNSLKSSRFIKRFCIANGAAGTR